jgi:antitoxin MazE
MEIKLQKWGNSMGIRIPSNVIKSLGIKEGDNLKLEQQNNHLLLSKIERKHLTLKERFANYSGPNRSKDFTWDEAKGREVW